MIRKYYDKILLGLALAILLAVFGYAALRPDPQQIAELVDIPALRSSNTYEVSEMPEIDLSVPRWNDAPPQSAGPDWVFDVFTPPVIHFNTTTEQFIIEGIEPPPAVPWPIELVSVRQHDYRIQMLGWIGRAGDYIINLENVETGELVLAREGRQYENLGITVRSFKVERINSSPQGGTPVIQDVATAVIYDERRDTEVTLRSDFRKKDEDLTAVFRATEELNQEFRARSGDTFTLGEYHYEVGELRPPASATVTRSHIAGEEEPETKVLIARETGDRSSASSDSTQTPRVETGREPTEDEPEESAAEIHF